MSFISMTVSAELLSCSRFSESSGSSALFAAMAAMVSPRLMISFLRMLRSVEMASRV